MTPRQPRPRAGLSREKVVDAAIGLVDAEGLARLSMRRLGAVLGVEGMTLYHYVPNKEALLDAMVERLLTEAVRPLPTDPAAPWRAVVAALADGLHGALLAHPGMLAAVATRPAASPAALDILEAGLRALRDRGVPPAVAMDLLNAVTTFVIGHTLAEAGRTPGHEGTEPQPDTLPVDPAAHPLVAEVFATGAGLDFDARFHLTLGFLLDGFATVI